MQTPEQQQLLNKFLEGKMTAAEISRFKMLLHNSESQNDWEQLIGAVLAEKRYGDKAAIDTKALYEELQQMMTPHKKRAPVHRVHFLRTAWFRYAAAVILLLGIGGYLLWGDRGEIPAKGGNDKGEVVRTQPPNNNKAILTLADGSQIILDDKTSGNIAQQGNTQIIKLDNNQLTYNSNPQKNSPLAMEGTVFDPRKAGQKPGVGALYNTITTPRGSQYQVILPDGTKAWLNAASTIKFPTAFTGKERRVEVTGEIYFEVKMNKSLPFFVSSKGVEVQVLGTSFNLNAYEDEEAVKTSLLEGSVKVNNQLLLPGQAYFKGKVVTINVEQDIAWKNNLFLFNESDIKTIMRQLSRWYDIEVEYKGDIKQTFVGEIPRTASLSDVLKIIESTGWVKFETKGRKVIVNNL